MISFDERVLLLAEDNDDEALLLLRAFRRARIQNPLHRVRDGAEAILYLTGEGKYADRQQFPIPSVLLLDLNMPRKSGFEVLSWIRENPKFRSLVTIVLTSSSRVEDADRVYALGGNFYITKPIEFDRLVDLVRTLQNWLKLNHFPNL